MLSPNFRISEIYQSLQGEGRLTGTPSIFLRTSGCNLRCTFCDTPFTSWNPEGHWLTLPAILERLQSFSAEHVVITGGEPMLPRGIVELTQAIRQLNKHITIETAGTSDRPVACDLLSLSPKLSNSNPTPQQAGHWAQRHEQQRLQPELIRRLIQRYDYQLKFVVDQPDDLDEILQLLQQLPTAAAEKVWLMPQGVELAELQARQLWLEPICRQWGFQLCQRKHIEWFGNRRGT